MTDLQLALVGPRICTGPGCDCRLSVADLGGLCVNCEYALWSAAREKRKAPTNSHRETSKRGPVPHLWCVCGQPVIPGRAVCPQHLNERTRDRRRQKSETHPDELRRWQAANHKRSTAAQAGR